MDEQSGELKEEEVMGGHKSNNAFYMKNPFKHLLYVGLIKEVNKRRINK